MSERHACFARVASGPLWENRFCLIPATVFARDHWWCWKHAPRVRAAPQRRTAAPYEFK